MTCILNPRNRPKANKSGTLEKACRRRDRPLFAFFARLQEGDYSLEGLRKNLIRTASPPATGADPGKRVHDARRSPSPDLEAARSSSAAADTRRSDRNQSRARLMPR